MNNVLVTGANGYIGTVMVKRLLQKKFHVTGLDTFFFKKSSLRNYASSNKIINLDIRNIVNLNLKKYDTIIHLAALCNDPLGEIQPQTTWEINYQATINLARKAKQNGVQKFIFASSCSVYGITDGKLRNERAKIYPNTTYAKSKAKAEKDLIKLADKNFCVVILRNSTVYGYSPQFRNDILVNNLVTQALAKGDIKLLSDGTPWRAMIDVRDLVEIYLGFIRLETKKINGQIFNIGFNENNFQVREILGEVAKKFPHCKIDFKGKKGNQGLSYQVDSRKFRKLLPGIKQKWPLSRSIIDLIASLKKNGFRARDYEVDKFNRLSTINLLLKKGLLDSNFYWK